MIHGILINIRLSGDFFLLTTVLKLQAEIVDMLPLSRIFRNNKNISYCLILDAIIIFREFPNQQKVTPVKKDDWVLVILLEN